MAKRKRLSKAAKSRVASVFSEYELSRICSLPEWAFEKRYGFERTEVQQPAPSNFYLHKDNGSNILAVAHLDTVADHASRAARFVDTEDGPVVFSRALDDRLGAYVILDMLPKLGINVDVLLTVGEEIGRSTAAFFETEKEYNWVIEFDRGGTDVVMYQYDDADLRQRVRDSGATPGNGILSDISYMEHLAIKCLNWGVGYRDYHGPRAHAFLNDTFKMVGYFLKFHEANQDIRLDHVEDTKWNRWSSRGSRATAGSTTTYGGGYTHGGGWSDYGWDYDDEAWKKYLDKKYGADRWKDLADAAKDDDTPSLSYGLGEPVTSCKDIELYHGLGFDDNDVVTFDDDEKVTKEHLETVDDYEAAVRFLGAESQTG